MSRALATSRHQRAFILVVDDNQDFLSSIAAGLYKEGFAPFPTKNPDPKIREFWCGGVDICLTTSFEAAKQQLADPDLTALFVDGVLGKDNGSGSALLMHGMKEGIRPPAYAISDSQTFYDLGIAQFVEKGLLPSGENVGKNAVAVVEKVTQIVAQYKAGVVINPRWVKPPEETLG
ncbi:MAG: hypothetical protein WAO98_00555 [Alphaproteobacteria bacterium]